MSMHTLVTEENIFEVSRLTGITVNELRQKIAEAKSRGNVFTVSRSHLDGALVKEHPPVIDYKELLRKYIQHVGEEEGTTFISDDRSWYFTNAVQFTDEEWAELNKLDKEGLRP